MLKESHSQEVVTLISAPKNLPHFQECCSEISTWYEEREIRKLPKSIEILLIVPIPTLHNLNYFCKTTKSALKRLRDDSTGFFHWSLERPTHN
jgi:hypothetical protein